MLLFLLNKKEWFFTKDSTLETPLDIDEHNKTQTISNKPAKQTVVVPSAILDKM